MKIEDIILFPYGGNSKEALSVIESINKVEKKWNILGFIDDDPNLAGEKYGKYKVLGGREILERYSDSRVLVIQGNPKTYLKRKTLIDSLNIEEDRFATIIHPNVDIGLNVQIGKNTLLMSGVVLTANITVGSNVVVLPNTVISHDSKVSDYCMIGSNVSISGGVSLNENCYIGSGSKLNSLISVGKKSLIGLGSVCLETVEDESIYAGVPARKLRGINES